MESSIPESTVTYCGEWWVNFWTPVNSVKKEFTVVICFLGCVTNILNILTFTRKRMRNPTNLILTALAVTDFLSVFRPFLRLSLYYSAKAWGEWRSDYQLAVEELVHDILFVLFHTWSIYLTLTIAIWRYLGVAYPLKSRRWCSWTRARWAVLSAIFIGLCLIPPKFFDRKIYLKSDFLRSNKSSLYEDPISCKELEGFEKNAYELRRSQFGDELAWYIHGILIKILPCVAMTIFSVGLVRSLIKARRVRRELKGNNWSPAKETSCKKMKRSSPDITPPAKTKLDETNTMATPITNKAITTQDQETLHCTFEYRKSKSKNKEEMDGRDPEFDRTTKMLLVVLSLFLITEFPFGLLGVMQMVINRREFYHQCYLPIRPFFNLNEYDSCVTSFFVYMNMSQAFRSNLVQICRQFSKSVSDMLCKRTGHFSKFPSMTTTTSQQQSAKTTTLSSSSSSNPQIKPV